MKKEVKIYCDGASMAYKDCAEKLDCMIANCPEEIRSLMIGLKPLADAMRGKSKEVYIEARRTLEGPWS